MENEWAEFSSEIRNDVIYTDNAYDITNFFCCFEKLLAYTLLLPSFIVVRHQMARVKLGGFLAPPPVHYRGIPDPVQNRVKVQMT